MAPRRSIARAPMPIASATLADIPKPISQLAKRRLIVGWSVDVHISHSPETSSRDETMANSNIASRPLRMGERVCSVPCVDVYGPRPIATGRRDQVQWSQLLTYIRLPDAARYFVAASPDGFSRASTSTAPRHWPRPCRSTHQVREATE